MDDQTTAINSPADAAAQPQSPLRTHEITAPLAHQRILAAGIFLSTLTVLLLAAWLTPHDKGHGTHQDLGLAPCGMLSRTGIPCMTCGMTTSFAYAADGNLVQSFINQPAGAMLAVVTAATCLVTGYATIVGMPIFPLASKLMRPSIVWAGLAVLLLAWVYKIVITLNQ